MADLSQEQWASQLENDGNAVVVDVRTLAEWDEGHMPGAVHMDIFKTEEFLEEVNSFDPEKSYYIYCRSGARSGQACSILDQFGFKKAYNLAGGFMKWTGPSEK